MGSAQPPSAPPPMHLLKTKLQLYRAAGRGSHLWIQATSISTTSITTTSNALTQNRTTTPPLPKLENVLATETPPLAKAWTDPPQKPRPKIDKKLTPAASRSPA